MAHGDIGNEIGGKWKNQKMPRILRNRKTLPEPSNTDQNEPQKKRSKINRPIRKERQSSSSSSESDIENYLKRPEDLDLNSTFFKPQETQRTSFESIEKDIFSGVNCLSDSGSDSEKNTQNEVERETQVPNKCEEDIKTPFYHLHEYNKKLEEAKKHVEEYKAKMKTQENNLDIVNILAMGESKNSKISNDIYSGLHSSDFESCSDSEKEDWEEVKTNETEEKQMYPKNGVEITLKQPDVVKKKKGMDLMAAFKRRINKIRKENQIYIHKVHLLCWIAHGNYINQILNDENILAFSLSLLPSQHCYPSDRVDLKYLEQILKWYKKAIKLMEKECDTQESLAKYLEKQINTKEVYGYRFFVYIFICILRSIGLRSRLVISLQVEPLRPPSSELCSLSQTETKGKVNKLKKLSKDSPLPHKKQTPQKGGKESATKNIKVAKKINSKKKQEPTKTNKKLENNVHLTDDISETAKHEKSRDKIEIQGSSSKCISSEILTVKKSKEIKVDKLVSKNAQKNVEKSKGNKVVENIEPIDMKNIQSEESNQNRTSLQTAHLTEDKNPTLSVLLPLQNSDSSGSHLKNKSVKSSGNKSKKLKLDKLKPMSIQGGHEEKSKEIAVNNKVGENDVMKNIENKESNQNKTKNENSDCSGHQLRSKSNAVATKIANPRKSDDRNENQSRNKSKKIETTKNLFKIKLPLKTRRNSKSTEAPFDVKEKEIKQECEATDSKSGISNQIEKINIKEENIKSETNIPQIDGSYDTEDYFITQLDGGNDTDSSTAEKIKKPNINKLKLENKNTCTVKAHSERLKKRPVTDSDDEFQPRSPLTKINNQFMSQKNPKCKEMDSKIDNVQPSSSQTHNLRKKVNLKSLSKGKNSSTETDRSKYFGTSSQKKSLDVRNDIISLIKKDLNQHKRQELNKIVKNKRKPQDTSDNDSDYMPEVCKKKASDYKEEPTKVKRRVPMKKDLIELEKKKEELQLEEKKNKGINIWVEVFSEAEEKWISVDVITGQIHCVKELYNRASHPISYILAWDNDNYIKDVTKRYCINWNTVTRKLRVDTTWWDATLRPFMGPKTPRDKEEDEDLATQQLEQPLPTTVSEYKNHPLYALKRHLLKFQAIYPPDALILGFVRKEPVYSRDCVHVLHSREIWLKHAKVVKPGEQPYKIVKARPKYDKLSNSMITGQLLEIFGSWQVENYEPPTAENGIVPRNAYGNVDLFKPCMLPKGTVHLQLPGLNKVARKMNVDCAPAMIGFDFHSGWSHPTFDGFIVCKEHEDTLIAAWYMEQEEAEKRSQEKVEKRVYDNWRKLIKGLFIRERLKARYDFGNPSDHVSKSGKSKNKSKGPRFCVKKR